MTPPAMPRVVASFAAIYLTRRSTFLAIRSAVETIPPFPMMALRCLLGGAIMLLISRVREPAAEWPAPAQWIGAAVVGTLFFVCCHGLLAREEQHVPSGLAALCLATIPLFVPLLAWSVLGSGRPSLRTAFALIAAFAGVAMLVARQGAGGGLSATDAALLLFTACSWAAGTIASRPLPLPSAPPAARAERSAGRGGRTSAGRRGAAHRAVGRVRRSRRHGSVPGEREVVGRPALPRPDGHGRHLRRLHVAARPRRADTRGHLRVREPRRCRAARLGGGERG